MAGVVTFENVTFIIALGGAAFAIFQFFRNPDIKNREDILKLQSTLSGFQNINEKIQNLGDNHIHTLEKKVDFLTESLAELRGELIKLSTIIEERIPKNYD